MTAFEHEPTPASDSAPETASEATSEAGRLRALASAWIDGDPDPVTREQLRDLLETGDEALLADHVGASLAFGTAGLRAAVGPGPNRMNRAVVIRTTRGLVDHLLATDPDVTRRGAIVGFDARHDSERFAQDAVGVFAAAGIPVRWFPTPEPTPLVPYAQKVLDAAAGVVVTASHNPPQDNGYKVYVDGAAQIVPPVDAAIAAAIDAVGAARDVPRVEVAGRDPGDASLGVVAGLDPGAPGAGTGLISSLPGEIVDRYLADIAAARPRVEGPDLRIVYTPLHGVGRDLAVRALAEARYHDVHVVPSQAEPDGDFPTVSFPNPEEPGAMDEAFALARELGAQLVLANDPDADRLAVAVPDREGGFRALTGNQIGVLLADHLLSGSDADRPLVVSSIVSTPMVHAVAEAHGALSEVTLTGFKWIWFAGRELERSAQRSFVYGFEEALGSSVGAVVRDKDGISAAVAFADLARGLAADGRSVADRWEELCRRHGLWISHQLAIARPGASGREEIAAAMARLEGDVPSRLAGHAVTASTDFRTGASSRPAWLAAHDLVTMDLSDGRAMIRPSGTEPKCKIYVDLCAEFGASDDLDARTSDLEREAAAVARALAETVGLL